MILAALSSVVMLQAAAAPAAPDAALERLKAKAEACIQANAAVVEHNTASLTDAATFLTEYACANEVGVFERYRTNVAMLSNMRGMGQLAGGGDDDGDTSPQTKALLAKQAAMYQAAHIDPDSGEIVYPAGTSPTFGAGIDILARSSDAPPELRALAARALLDARQARLNH